MQLQCVRQELHKFNKQCLPHVVVALSQLPVPCLGVAVVVALSLLAALTLALVEGLPLALPLAPTPSLK